MDKPIEHYWRRRLADLKKVLEANNFEVFLAGNAAEAHKIVLDEILPKLASKSIA